MKKNILIIALSLLCATGQMKAQFTPAWNNSYQHTGTSFFSNEGRKVVQDASGNIFALADVTSDKDLTGTVTGLTYHYSVILKYSSSGVLLNEATILVNSHLNSGFTYQSAFGLQLDASGNVYIGYNFNHTISLSDIRLNKYDNNLNLIWGQKYNFPTVDVGTDMRIDATNKVYIIGSTNNGGVLQHHLFKSNDATLELTIIESFNANEDVLNSLYVDGNNSIYVTGYRTVGGFKNVLTSSVSNTGVLNWTSIYNGGTTSRDDFGRQIMMGADNNLYIVGTSDRGAPNGNDVLIMKLAQSSGKKIWISFEHFNTLDQGAIINAVDPTSVYIGSTSGNSIVLTSLNSNHGNRKARAVYSPVPDNPHSSLNGAGLTSMIITSNIHFFITGTIKATDLSGVQFNACYLARFDLDPIGRGGFGLKFANTVIGAADENYIPADLIVKESTADVYWLRNYFRMFSNHETEIVLLDKFDVPSPVRFSNASISENQITISPNPASDHINIAAEKAIDYIELYDIHSRLVNIHYIHESRFQLNISQIPPGLYMVKIHSVDQVVTEILVIK